MWKQTYNIEELFISSEHENDETYLIVEVMGFHREKYPLAHIYEKSGCLTNHRWTFPEKVRAIADYVINNALFPYPVEELV